MEHRNSRRFRVCFVHARAQTEIGKERVSITEYQHILLQGGQQQCTHSQTVNKRLSSHRGLDARHCGGSRQPLQPVQPVQSELSACDEQEAQLQAYEPHEVG